MNRYPRWIYVIFFSSIGRHTISVSAFLLNRSSDLDDIRNILCGMALLILALLQRIFLMSSLMLLLVWLIFFMVLIKLLPILGTISGKTVKIGRASCRERVWITVRVVGV